MSGVSGSHSARLKRKPVQQRLTVVLVVLALLFAAIGVRLVFLQVIDRDQLVSQSDVQRLRTVKLASTRGTIFDRNGNDLALSIPQNTIWADPSLVEDAQTTAWKLSPVLGKDYLELQEKLSQRGRFVYLARMVSDDTAKQVKALELPGIAMYEEPKRVLAGQSMLSSVIGYVGVDNEGLSGLEQSLEKTLAGTPGRMQVERDLTGKNIPGGLRQMTPALPGSDVVLTIDRNLQNKVEESLGNAIRRTTARGGIAIIMDVKTGEILALSNLVNKPPKQEGAPTTTTTTSASAGPDTRVGAAKGSVVEAASHNMALTDVFEPGSTSKLVTVAAALQENLITPATTFVTPDTQQIYDTKFGDAEPHPTYTWSTTDIVTASSNIGIINIGTKLGKDRLTKYQKLFGYGTKTGLNYPGESTGLVIEPKKFSGTTLATSSIGQGVSVTALQMLGAFNTIANDGTYVAPKLVRATVDGKGKVQSTPNSATHEVVSAQVAQQTNLMLQEVVRAGTATAAQVDGYRIAGKTGTAKKLASDGKGYKDGAYIASFAGFAPAEDPRFSAIVILDEPTPIYGGLVAAPVFSEISRYLLQHENVSPSPPVADRMGVPVASSTATSSADESGVAGTTAEKAIALTENANASKLQSTPETGTSAGAAPRAGTGTTGTSGTTDGTGTTGTSTTPSRTPSSTTATTRASQPSSTTPSQPAVTKPRSVTASTNPGSTRSP